MVAGVFLSQSRHVTFQGHLSRTSVFASLFAYLPESLDLSKEQFAIEFPCESSTDAVEGSSQSVVSGSDFVPWTIRPMPQACRLAGKLSGVSSCCSLGVNPLHQFLKFVLHAVDQPQPILMVV